MSKCVHERTGEGLIFETAPYRLTRTEFARVAAKEYLRTFWWFFAITPLFGLILLIFTQGLLQVIGMTAILWPFSIPARSILNTNKASRLFTGGCRLAVFEDRLEFRGETPERKSGKPLRMILAENEIRDVVRRGDYLMVRTYRLRSAPVAVAAFADEEQIDAFIRSLQPGRDVELPG